MLLEDPIFTENTMILQDLMAQLEVEITEVQMLQHREFTSLHQVLQEVIDLQTEMLTDHLTPKEIMTHHQEILVAATADILLLEAQEVQTAEVATVVLILHQGALEVPIAAAVGHHHLVVEAKEAAEIVAAAEAQEEVDNLSLLLF